MTKIWGEKPIAAATSGLNNVKRLSNLISARIEELVKSSQVELVVDTTLLQSISQAYLADLVKREVIRSGSVESTKVQHHTWTSLYPKLFDRLRAMLAKFIGVSSYYYEPRWFHVLFPFKTRLEVYAIEDFFDDSITKEDYQTYVYKE